jgi:hypothetical protein
MTQPRFGVMAVAIVASFACAGGAAPEEAPRRELPMPDGNPLRLSPPSAHPAGKAQPSVESERQGSREANSEEAIEEPAASRQQRSSSPPSPAAARQVTRAKTPEEALEEYAASLKTQPAPAPRSSSPRTPSGGVEAPEAR